MSHPEPDSRPRVLIIEDDRSTTDVVRSFLTMRGHACSVLCSGTEARSLVRVSAAPPDRAFPFDVVLCDLMLPEVSGEQIIQDMRSLGIETPVIVLSAKKLLNERVTALRLGANDYLVKPFELEELLARIEVQLRASRRPNGDARADELAFGRWVARADRREFFAGGVPVRLTRSEFDIVLLLMTYPTRAFTQDELLEEAYRDGGFHDGGTARTHISNIRSKLKGTGTEDYIETVWGFGFKLTEDPS